LGIRA